jgi:hypothetical protein
VVNFKRELDSRAGKKVHSELKELGLPTLPDVHEDLTTLPNASAITEPDSSGRTGLRAHLRRVIESEVLAHDLKRIHFGIAARCTPAIGTIILAGALLHQTQTAAIMCGGALTVGSGVYQRIGRSQIGPMVLATLGMGVSASVGTLAGLSPVALVAAVAVWGFAAGIMPVLDGGGQWIGQQCAIALLVASSFPGTLNHALIRGGLVAAGGVLQIITIETLLHFGDVSAELKGWRETRHDARDAWDTLRRAIDRRSPALRFALRVAVVVAAAVMTERMLALPNGYWVGMTTLLLLRRQLHDTWHRTASRVCGTLGGAAAVMLAVRTGLPPWAFAVAVPLVAFFCFALQQFSYAIFSFCLTAYIVLLLTYAGLQEQLVAHNRIVGTLLGAGFALAGHLHFLASRKRGPVHGQSAS